MVPLKKIQIEKIQKELEPYPGARLLGVTKGQTPEKVRDAVRAGLRLLGNNYAQEGEALREALKEEKVEWHYIGHIQSRKAKDLIAYDCVQSLDRIEIAQAFTKHLKSSLDVLIQVNIGEEPQKSGVLPQDLEMVCEKLKEFTLLQVRGLMAIPPLTATPEERRPYFRKMRQLYEVTEKFFPVDTLSMGMSDDYRIALDEGSNLVRLGTLLFGARV